jgi:hypothetical protein
MRTAFLLLLGCTVSSFAAEPLKPGLTVGQRPGPYSFLVATGPQRGQQTCYICEQENKPMAVVFARGQTPQLAKLLLELDSLSTKQKDSGYKAWMTLLDEKADLDQLGKWAQRQGLKTLAVGVFEDADGPPAYKIPGQADIVLILARDKKVQSSFAWRSGELNDQALKAAMTSAHELFKK